MGKKDLPERRDMTLLWRELHELMGEALDRSAPEEPDPVLRPDEAIELGEFWEQLTPFVEEISSFWKKRKAQGNEQGRARGED